MCEEYLHSAQFVVHEKKRGGVNPYGHPDHKMAVFIIIIVIVIIKLDWFSMIIVEERTWVQMHCAQQH